MAKQGRYIGKALLATFAALALASCDMMHDDMDDCRTGTTDLRVDFKYDMNLKWADAFDHEVKRVTLYAFGADGQLAYQKTEDAADIISRGGYMDVNDINPARYTLKVWAEGDNRHDGTWTYGTTSRAAGEGGIKELTARIARTEADLNHDLTPLFHGLVADADLTKLPTDYVSSKNPVNGVRTVTVPLTKDTKNIRIVLQNTSSEALSADDFRFTITDDNGYLDYDNSLIADGDINYHEWTKEAITMDDQNTDQAERVVSAVVAELTTSRLLTSHKPFLTVTNVKTGKTVFKIPFIDYALMVKGKYNSTIDDQEYLDRQDEYNFVFFLSNGNTWLASSVIINSWRVVLQNADLGE